MTRKVVSPIALDKSINTTEQTPRNIADVLAQQLAAIKTAIESGNGNLEAAFVCYYGVTTATQIKDAIEDGKVPYFYYNGSVAQLWKVETDKYTFRTTNTRSVEGQTILDVVDYVVNGSVWSTVTREVSGGSSSGQSYIASVNSLADFDTTGKSGMQDLVSVANVPADGVYQVSVMLHITPKTASATKSDLVLQFASSDNTGWHSHTFHAVVDDSQTFAQQLSFSTSVSLKAGENTLRIQCGGLNTEYLVFVDELTVAQLVNGVYHNGDDFADVHTLAEAADFNNDDGVLVDGATGGPRFMLWQTLANKVLGFIKSLSTTITSFRTGDMIPVDGPSGTAKMPSEFVAQASMTSNKTHVMMQWGCFYANAFTSRNQTKARAGSIVLKAMVGSIIELPTIAGISFSIDMQDDVAAPTNTSSTGWLSVSRAVVEYEYISILAKKNDGTDFTMDEVDALSRQMLVRLFVVSENPANDGTYASTEMAHTMSKSLADETLLLLPTLEIGDFDSSGNERSTQEGRCRSSVIETAEEDMYIAVKAGFKFWGFVWDGVDNFVGSLFNREVKHGDVGKILKGTRYRLVVAKDPEVYVFNEVNDYSNALLLLPHSSIIEKIIDDKAETCKFIFDPILEVGSVNPSTGENASHNGRCRSVDIEQASEDIYLKVSTGYRFWGFKYAADDSFIGPIWGFDVTQDSYGIIPAGTRYRLVVAKDPEVYTGANPYDYAQSITEVTALGQRLLDDEDKITGYYHLSPSLEVGTVNPSTGENASQNGRCRSVVIETASEDMYISVNPGYRVWAIGYASDDSCTGSIFNREIYAGDYEKICAGQKYRLVVAKDPEVYTGANSVIYSRQVLLLTEQAVKVSNISLFFGSLEPFGMYGKTAESRRTTTKRITEYKPYNIAAQSTAIDRANKKMYRLCGEADTNVYVMSMEGFPIETITNKGSTGHDNDSCVVGDSLYIVGSSSSTNYLYKWTPSSGVVASVDVSAITDNPNGSHRVLDGVCSSLDGTKLYLVCHDFTIGQELNPKADDKLSVYELVIASGVISLVAELEWDCVYIQGATLVDGLLYVNCNTMTTGTPSNYVGVTLKVIDTSNYSLVDSILFEGFFEGEGLDYFIDNGVLKLVTCFVNNGYRADLCKFIPNW